MKKIISAVLIFLTVFLAINTLAAELSPWAAEEINGGSFRDYAKNAGFESYTLGIKKGEMASLLAAACLSCGLSVELICQNPFSDLNDPVSLAAAALGIFEGETETAFFPDKVMTRLDAVKAIYAAQQLIWEFSPEEKADFVYEAREAACDEHDREAVGFALYYRVLKGMENGELKLNEDCSVEQALVMVTRSFAQ